MLDSHRREMIGICERVSRKCRRISLASFRRNCVKEMPEWARDEISDSTDFSVPVLDLVDSYFVEWQRKIKWNKDFKKKC